PEEIFGEIIAEEICPEEESSEIKLSKRISKKEYFENFAKIISHIQRGDIYEMNYCQEFFAENVVIEPKIIFKKLCEISPAPFSCYYKLNDHFLLCSSPERFLKKHENK